MSQENLKVVRGVPINLPPLSESAIQRRTVDERCFVRVPALYRLVVERLNGLSPGSRVRQALLPRVIRRGYAAGSRRDFEFLLQSLDPEIEFRPNGGLSSADLDSVLHGHDGYREAWERTLDAFDDLRLVPEEVLDLGDNFLLVTVQYTGHGSGSGVPVSQQVFQLLETRRGLVIKIEDFTDRSEALEAAGLKE